MQVEQLFVESLIDMNRKLSGNPSEYDLLKVSSLLRPILLENLLKDASAATGLDAKFRVVKSGPPPIPQEVQKQVDEAWAKFLATNPDVQRVEYAVSIRGDLLTGVPSQPGDQVLELGHEDFLAHGIIVYMDTDYTVEHALRVAANSLGGTHNDGKPNRNKDSERLRQYMEGSTTFGRSLPAWYIAQIAECTLRACLPLANKLTELGLYSGTPSEWKWSRGGAGGGEGQTPTPAIGGSQILLRSM